MIISKAGSKFIVEQDGERKTTTARGVLAAVRAFCGSPAAKSSSNNRNLEQRGSVFYVRATVSGKPIHQSLETTSIDIARERRDRVLEAARSGRWSDVESFQSRPSNRITVGELLEVYMRIPPEQLGQRRAETRTAARARLRQVLAFAGHDEPDTVPLDELSAATVQKFERRSIEIGNRAETTKSIWHQARGVFSKLAMDQYEAEGIKIPVLQSFLSAGSVRPLRRAKYRLPAEDTVKEILNKAHNLKADRPDLYVVFLLSYYCALRPAESSMVRYSWFRKVGENYILDIIERPDEKFDPKQSERSVPISATVYDELRECGADGDFILPGQTKPSRRRLVVSSFASWMRSVGWSGRTCAYDLRRWMGSRWWNECDPSTAQRRLGHAEMRTTEESYAEPCDGGKVIPMGDPSAFPTERASDA